MKAEIIAVGSELLLGDVVNSNAAWLSKELAELGIDVYYHVTVGDNPKRIHEIVQTAVNRSDILIFTGGLGPTEDDLTIATLADYFQAPLEEDPQSAQTIRDYFITRDMPMSNTNLKQALKPQGAETITNPIGTAPGIFWDLSAKTGKTTFILTFPGVPKELYAMWPQGRERLQARQQAAGEEKTVLVTRFLQFFGIGESKLGEMLRDLMQQENPTVAPYVGQAEVKIRIAAKATSEAEANRLIEPVKTEILQRANAYYFGETPTTLEQCVAALLLQQEKTVSVAESCTGGLVSSRLTDVPGSSAYTQLNVVTYSNEQKTKLLGVRPETLAQYGAVSPQVAVEMAIGAQTLADSDIGLSLTGIAGPDGGSEEKPVGLVYLGFCRRKDPTPLVKKIMVNRHYARADIKYWFSQYALHFLRLLLEGRLESDIDPSPVEATPSAGRNF